MTYAQAIELCALLGLPHRINDGGLPTNGLVCWEIIRDYVNSLHPEAEATKN